MRRTKIVATIGPACDEPRVLEETLVAGVDVARISLAHDNVERVLQRLQQIRNTGKKLKRPVGVMLDLPGPKIRSAAFPEDGIHFVTGSTVDLRPGNTASTAEVMEVNYDALLTDIEAGDTLAVGDGTVQLLVQAVKADSLEARVIHGGNLLGSPGVHIPSERLSLASPTERDLECLQPFLEEEIEMVAMSFVRTGEDVRRLQTKPPPDGPLLISKIETRGAVENLADIVDASGAIMVARGDLGVEFPIEQVPLLQKRIIRECIAKGLPVVTATQMLESMITSLSPTRAEASDIANAVFDGTSAVMLSAETAVGVNPAHVVSTMSRITEQADDAFDDKSWARLVEELRSENSKVDSYADSAVAQTQTRTVTDAITMAAWRVASEKSLVALLCISGSGLTVRSMARFRPRSKILGFTSDPRVVRQLTLSWGVKVYQISAVDSYEARVNEAIEIALQQGEIQSGDEVGVLAGLSRHSRVTDVLRLVTVR